MMVDSTLFDAVDTAAQQRAAVVGSLEDAGDAALYRSALEAHASTALLRAEGRARLRAPERDEQRWAESRGQA